MLRIEIKQNIACYQIPEIGNPILTYPLVPPSTVFGLLRAICDYESINFENTQIAISGSYETKTRHIITNHITGISDKGIYKSNIIPTEELYNVSHIIHIKSSEDFENKIMKNLYKATRLGRKEDLITEIKCEQIDSLTEINAENLDLNQVVNIDDYLYIPFDKNRNMEALSIFRISLDSDKSLLDQGVLKMHFIRVLFLKVQSFILKKEKLLVSEHNDGKYYVFEWINDIKI